MIVHAHKRVAETVDLIGFDLIGFGLSNFRLGQHWSKAFILSDMSVWGNDPLGTCIKLRDLVAD